ncbi:unnamed protein product [Prorocentrum cordatum]|uniref:Uncharacterized protein n=1 Tax=Prorocentrum cordatum TaxID=2364126 RepID=A0ABN9XCD2_9DINO|nr:unnamed protein product [Polarella glacialis]
MAALRAHALPHAGPGPRRQGPGSGDAGAPHGDLGRRVPLRPRGMLTAGRPPPAPPARAGGAVAAAEHGVAGAWARGASQGADVEELLRMRRLLAEKLGAAGGLGERPIRGGAGRAQGEPATEPRPPRVSQRPPSSIVEASGCSRGASSSGSASSSPQESPRRVARALLRDGLAYVVR